MVDGKRFFSRDDGTHGEEPWISDGTPEGTAMLQDLNPGPGGSFPRDFTGVGGTLFFSADDGTHGREPWALPIPGYHPPFRRGDANDDAKIDVSDAIAALGFLFLGNPGKLPCEKSADSTDDGKVDISDAVHLLSFLFLGGPPPGNPFRECGSDPSDDSLRCDSSESCP